MERSINKITLDGVTTTTTGHEQGREHDLGGGEEPFNPFARASRVGRTPPRPRVNSCPDSKPISSELLGLEERDKRKRAEITTPPADAPTAECMREKDPERAGEVEVFTIEGSPSPESTRETKKKKEGSSSSSHTAWDDLSDNPEVTEMSMGLRHLVKKMEFMAGDLLSTTRRNTNTKVEIKKLARELDSLSRNVTQKLHKFFNALHQERRESCDRDVELMRSSKCTTSEVACQTDPPPRKREGTKMVTEASTDQEIVDAANKRWSMGLFQATAVNEGNPWNSTGEEDFAIFVQDNESEMDSGIARLLRDRFPEVGGIKGTGSLKVINSVQVGAAAPTTRTRFIHKVRLGGTTDYEVLAALRVLDGLTLDSKCIAVPAPTGTDGSKLRKLAELVFRKRDVKVVIHIPQGRGGKGKNHAKEVTVKEKTRRVRNTDVLLVKQAGKTYGDMVRGLRTLVGVKNDAIKEVRKAQDGRLLLSFKKGEPEMESMRSLIQTSWEGAQVSGSGRGDSRKAVLHLKGLDAAVEEEEIREAVRSIAPNLQEEDLEIGVRRPAFGGNLAVTLKVPNRCMQDLRRYSRLKVGLNTCRIEERVQVTKCFRCWEFGHLARACKGPDRRNLCSGCGQEGHLVAECRNAPHCVLCAGANHRSGAAGCPKFREALRIEKLADGERPYTQSSKPGGEHPPTDGT